MVRLRRVTLPESSWSSSSITMIYSILRWITEVLPWLRKSKSTNLPLNWSTLSTTCSWSMVAWVQSELPLVSSCWTRAQSVRKTQRRCWEFPWLRIWFVLWVSGPWAIGSLSNPRAAWLEHNSILIYYMLLTMSMPFTISFCLRAHSSFPQSLLVHWQSAPTSIPKLLSKSWWMCLSSQSLHRGYGATAGSQSMDIRILEVQDFT